MKNDSLQDEEVLRIELKKCDLMFSQQKEVEDQVCQEREERLQRLKEKNEKFHQEELAKNEKQSFQLNAERNQTYKMQLDNQKVMQQKIAEALAISKQFK